MKTKEPSHDVRAPGFSVWPVLNKEGQSERKLQVYPLLTA
jgi:hypothetical protein